MDIKYTITMHSYWHCGSGLAAGSDVDALVVKDSNGLPFVPGKTMKGLVKEAVEEILSLRGYDAAAEELFYQTFGRKDNLGKGCAFFTNAALLKEEQKYLSENSLQPYLYKSISNTAIDEKGVAKGTSLRKTQVVVPCSLHGEIKDVPDSISGLVSDALSFVKCLGIGRNRGLGRCTITVKP